MISSVLPDVFTLIIAIESTRSEHVNGSKRIIIQLTIWDRLNLATTNSVGADFLGLLTAVDESIEQLPPNDKLAAAGEAIRRLGEIYADRSAMQLCEIEYLFRPEQEPIMSLDAFDRYVRQSMLVDLEQFIEVPELPEYEREYNLTIDSNPDLSAAIETCLAAGGKHWGASQIYDILQLEFGLDPETCSLGQVQAWLRQFRAHRPQEVLAAAVNGGWILYQIQNPRELDFLMMTAPGKEGTRQVGRQGISVCGRLYVAVELAGWIGKTVYVCFDPQQPSTIYVYGSDRLTEFVCQAVWREAADIDLADIANRARHLYQILLRSVNPIRKRGKTLLRKLASDPYLLVGKTAQELTEVFQSKLHVPEIANYFQSRTTSGVTEGLNTKIKLIVHQSYGFKNFNLTREKLLGGQSLSRQAFVPSH
jgi:Mu transposase, C-terminal/Transposase